MARNNGHSYNNEDMTHRGRTVRNRSTNRMHLNLIIILIVCLVFPALSMSWDDAMPETDLSRQVNELRNMVDDNPREVLKRGPELLAELQSKSMPDVELTMLALMSDAYLAVGEPRLALNAADKWEQAADRYQDLTSKANSLNNQGICWWELGNESAALSAYRSALELVKKQPDPDLELDVLNNLGMLYSQMGDLETALDYLLRVEDESDPEKNPVGFANTLNSIGVLYREAAMLTEARQYFNRSLELHMKYGNKRGEADARNNLGVLYQQEGRPDLALQYYEASFKLEQSLGNRIGLAAGLSNMAEANIQLNNVSEARSQFEQALSIYREVDEPARLTDVEIKLARLYRQEGSLDQALKLARQALDRASGMDDRSLHLRVLAELASIQATLGDFQSAYQFQSEYMNLAGRVQVERAGQKAAEMEARVELREKDREITLLQEQQKGQRRLIEVVIGALVLVMGMLSLAVFAYRSKARTNREIREVNRELLVARDELHRLSRIDPLTGLENRRSMTERLKLEKSRFVRQGRPFTLILGDIDHFKRINDEFGHGCGDDVLQEIARILKQTLREQDGISRWGGEEFLILLPETDMEGGRIAAEKIRTSVEEMPWKRGGRKIPVTITLGVAMFSGGDIKDTLVRADDALYAGKDGGRNRVVVEDRSAPAGDLAADRASESS